MDEYSLAISTYPSLLDVVKYAPSGAIPPEIKKYRVFRINGGGLTTVPEELFTDEMYAKHMFRLDLYNNLITQIPDALFRFQRITELNFSINKLTEIPDAIGELTTLKFLSVHSNNIMFLPESIGNCKKLRGLYIADNDLRDLPNSLTQLSRLEELYVEENKLTGLPDLSNFPKLREFRADSNSILTIPESIGSLENLKELNLANNKINRIPESIGNLQKLTRLHLHHNELTEIPESICNCTELQYLDLSTNRITAIPTCIDNLSRLSKLHLFNNMLTMLPDSITNLNLSILRVDENRLEQLPTTTWTSGGMHALDLSRNRLSRLPDSIGTLRYIDRLHASGNLLSTLPSSLAGSTINNLALDNNQFVRIPSVVTRLEGLTTLYMENNRLKDLPYDVVNYDGLRSLYVDQNPFTDQDLRALASNSTDAKDFATYLRNLRSGRVSFFTSMKTAMAAIPLADFYASIFDNAGGLDALAIREAAWASFLDDTVFPESSSWLDSAYLLRNKLKTEEGREIITEFIALTNDKIGNCQNATDAITTEPIERVDQLIKFLPPQRPDDRDAQFVCYDKEALVKWFEVSLAGRSYASLPGLEVKISANAVGKVRTARVGTAFSFVPASSVDYFGSARQQFTDIIYDVEIIPYRVAGRVRRRDD